MALNMALITSSDSHFDFYGLDVGVSERLGSG